MTAKTYVFGFKVLKVRMWGIVWQVS